MSTAKQFCCLDSEAEALSSVGGHEAPGVRPGLLLAKFESRCGVLEAKFML